MKSLVYLFSFLLVSSASAQSYTVTYRNPSDSSTNYYVTVPPVGQPKGVLLLLPGYGELPESVYTETDLPKQAAQRGLLTVIATLQQGFQSFYIDSASQKTLDDIIHDVQIQYKLSGKKLYVGGFSLGGSGAVRYAERAASAVGLAQPNAVFAIDPPLDFRRLYESMSKVKRQSKAEVAVNEARFFTERMRQEFGGDPSTHLSQYIALSPYCHADTTAQNASLLRKTPVRLIAEPDIDWQMKERNRDLYDMNAIDCVALINYLVLAGNSNAVFVQTSGKGYRRQQKIRNPHSWSIADSKTTLDWLLRY